MRFARWVFIAAAITGLVMVVPAYFLEEQFDRDNPPPITYPKFYYGFFSVTLSWHSRSGSRRVTIFLALTPLLERASLLEGILAWKATAAHVKYFPPLRGICSRPITSVCYHWPVDASWSVDT